MNMMNRIIKCSLFACAVSLPLMGCSDDSSATNADNVINLNDIAIPDSIMQSDSLYTWYMESLGKEEVGGSSSSEEGSVESSGSSKTTKVYMLPPAGFYSGLTIPAPVPQKGGEIRCTFDGSVPTEETPKFEGGYEVKRNMVVRCAEFAKGNAVRSATETYFINENVSMPVVAISVDSVFFRKTYHPYPGCAGQDPSKYCYPELMAESEYPVHVEFFERGSASTEKTWEIDAGISLMGQWSRTYNKKPVAIKMKSEYQDGRLKYEMFSTRPEAKKFKGFNLRNGGNRFVGDFIADPAMTSIVEGSSVDYQRSRQVVVFYNGVYMGIHDLRERLNEHFVETNYGIDSKSVDMVRHVRKEVTASGGSADSYMEMLNFIGSSDFSGSNNEAYKKVQSYMDVGNYADYMAAEIYFRNADWPSNNVRAWRSPEQPYKFILFDVDQGFGWSWVSDDFKDLTGTMFDWIRHPREGSSGEDRTQPGYFANIYIQLSKNPDFRRMFANHGAVMLSTYLTSQRVSDAVDRVNSEIPVSEMERDLGNERVFQRDYCPYGSSPMSFDRTGSYVKSYATQRTQTTRNEYREEFGLGDDISVTISADGSGSVLLDGMTLPNSNYTGTFFEGNEMLLEAIPKSGSIFVKWFDGSTENPRMVMPGNGDVYKAIFK